jgi:hypothetical protein
VGGRGWGGGKRRGGRGGKGGEMTQTLYVYINKRNFKKECISKFGIAICAASICSSVN